MNESKILKVVFDSSLPGIISKMSGIWTEEDVSVWKSLFIECYTQNCSGKAFKVLLDMRNFRPLSEELRKEVEELQKTTLHLNVNLSSSAVVTDSIRSELKMKSIAKSTGIIETEGYFSDYDVAYSWLKSK